MNDTLHLVQSVFHPTDFSEESENAFAHALAISVIRETNLTILHAGNKYLAGNEWIKFPAVRKMLERWHVLDEGSSKEDVAQLGIEVQKIDKSDPDPVRASMRYLNEHPKDVIVLATGTDKPFYQQFLPSKAEKLAEKSHTMTLFVPKHAKGFVNAKDGTLTVRRILIPVDISPSAVDAIEYAMRVATVMHQIEDGPVDIVLLYVGKQDQMPVFSLEEDTRWNFIQEAKEGPVVDVILKRSYDIEADLIIMMTEGHHGIFDALRGSTTEQVLRKARCPLLAVPANKE